VQHRAVLEREPQSAEAHDDLGMALAGMGRFSEAAARFKEALRLEPDFTEARTNLEKASSLLAPGRFPDSVN